MMVRDKQNYRSCPKLPTREDDAVKKRYQQMLSGMRTTQNTIKTEEPLVLKISSRSVITKILNLEDKRSQRRFCRFNSLIESCRKRSEEPNFTGREKNLND